MGRASPLDAHHATIRSMLVSRKGRNQMARELTVIVQKHIDPAALRRYIHRHNLDSEGNGWSGAQNTPIAQGKTVQYEQLPDEIRLAIARMVLDSDSDHCLDSDHSNRDNDSDPESDFDANSASDSDGLCSSQGSWFQNTLNRFLQ